MKQYFIINCNRNSYGIKSISGYKKIYLLKSFEKSLIDRNLYNSLYFAFEILCSGYYNDFWSIIFLFYFEYVHIINPSLPFFLIKKYNFFKKLEKKIKDKKINKLKIRNIFIIQSDIISIIKNLINTKNKHISFFIKQQYNHQNSYQYIENKYILLLFKRFKLFLNKLINNRLTLTQTSTEILNEFFDVFGKLMVINCENSNIVDYPFHINIYHHDIKNKSFNNISNIFWNTIISSSKFNVNIFKQIGSIFKIFDTKIISKLYKESYIYITSTLFFIYKINDINIINNTKDDFNIIKNFYENIQLSINNNTTRLDFIEIYNKNNLNKKNKKYKDTTIKKQKQKNDIKVNINDIIIKMKPINYIINDIDKKKENINIENIINKNNIIEKKNNINDDILSYNITLDKYSNTEKNEIEIEIDDNSNTKITQYSLFKNFLFDENNIPLIDNNKINKNIKDENNSILKNISIPNNIYNKSILSKPFKDIIKN